MVKFCRHKLTLTWSLVFPGICCDSVTSAIIWATMLSKISSRQWLWSPTHNVMTTTVVSNRRSSRLGRFTVLLQHICLRAGSIWVLVGFMVGVRLWFYTSAHSSHVYGFISVHVLVFCSSTGVHSLLQLYMGTLHLRFTVVQECI